MFKEIFTEKKREFPTFWDILKDHKNVKDGDRHLTTAPVNDVYFSYGSVGINGQTNKKGSIYKYKDFSFCTRINSKKKFEVLWFDEDGVKIHSDFLSVKMLLKKLPLQKYLITLGGERISTISNARLIGSNGDLVIDFKNGAVKNVSFYGTTNFEKMERIEKALDELLAQGFKINKARTALKVLLPEIYNKRKISNFKNTDDLQEYLYTKMKFGFQSTGGITGEGIYFGIDKNSKTITLNTQPGGSYYGTWSKFNIKLTVPINKATVDNKIEKYLEYKQKKIGNLRGYSKGLSDYVKSTGGHHGNPVYMD